MTLRINHNTAAINSWRNLERTDRAMDSTLVNCTVVGNQCDDMSDGGGIYFHGDLAASHLLINSSILWGNRSGEQWSQIVIGGTTGAFVRYSQVQGGWPGWENSGAEPPGM